eukprot:6199205-Pleurochrysis_carterae.AAC.2
MEMCKMVNLGSRIGNECRWRQHSAAVTFFASSAKYFHHVLRNQSFFWSISQLAVGYDPVPHR